MQSSDQISPQEALRQQKAIEQVNEMWRRQFHAASVNADLRKWCLDLAITKGNYADPVKLAAEMMGFLAGAFLTEPLTRGDT